MDTHEQVCTERYGNIDRQLNEIKENQRANATQMHERLNALSQRQWHGLVAVLAVAVGAFGSVAIFWINALVGKH